MNDYTFSASDLVEGKLIVPGVVVGGFAIEDSSGQLVLVAQKRTSGGVEVDFSGFEVTGNWKIRFFRGEPGKNTTGGITETEALIYALTFG